MSLSHALSNALSGLRVASRSAEIVSNNVANAMTPGYSRRDVDISASVVDGRGDGARVSGVRLAQDAVSTATRRRLDAQLGATATEANTLARIADGYGLPGDAGALASRAVAFETALSSAASDPASSTAQSAVVRTAKALTTKINDLSTENRGIRMEADTEIGRQVRTVNDTLAEISKLNGEIRVRAAVGGDSTAMMDQRNQLVDRLASIVPLRVVRREGEQVALYSKGGITLLDGQPSELGFTQSGMITPDMSIGAGSLSGLTVNGQPVPIGEGAGKGLLDGGSLSALFETRDVIVPQADAQLDAFAAELITRFEDPALDPTRLPGDPGLFTDAGGAYSALTETGLARRIEINVAVDPIAGGAVWRIRDGLGAAAPGTAGSSTLLRSLQDAVTALRSPAPALGVVSPMSLAGFAAEITTQASTKAAAADEQFAYVAAQNHSIRAAESAATGVNTDTEMQRLMMVEQAYIANARVMSVIDELMRRLVEI